MTIVVSDYRNLYRWGARYATDRTAGPVIDAAEYYVVADESEKSTVRMEFHEGVRNHAKSQYKVDECMKDFEDWVSFWEGKYEMEKTR